MVDMRDPNALHIKFIDFESWALSLSRSCRIFEYYDA
jgi:hypothetical protein